MTMRSCILTSLPAALAAVLLLAPASAHAQCAPEYCGTVSPQGCWCDRPCAWYGDCCPDYETTCRVPRVDLVYPATIPTTGRQVQLFGGGFGVNPQMTLLTEPPQPLEVISATEESALVLIPAGVGANVDLMIENELNISATIQGIIRYEPPAITAVTPTTGPTSGSIPLTIAGENFGPGTIGSATVLIGGNFATITGRTHNEITCVLPEGAGAAQAIDVVVGQQAANPWTFNYDPPVITTITPNDGPTDGGATITIVGESFGSGGLTQVRINDEPAGVLSASHAQIVALTPAGEGTDNAVVVTTAGQASDPLPYRYAPPQIDAITPANGPTRGGVLLTLTGSNFGLSPRVTIGGNVAPLAQPPSSSTLVCESPAGEGTNRQVLVSAADQTSNPIAFNYDRPQITDIDPTSGPATGGIPLTIHGENFGLAPIVTLAGIPAEIESATHDQVVAITPAVGGANLPVVVIAAAQASDPFDGYYTELTITDVEPRSGPLSGNTPITITGGAFSLNPIVTIDGVLAPVTSVPDDATIVALTPAGQGTDLPVVVTDQAVSSAPFYGFSYLSRPIVTNITPNTGPTRGNITITVAGQNFGAVDQVTVGGVPCTNLAPVGDNAVTCTLPAGQGTDVPVVASAGAELSDPVPFSYFPPQLDAISPASGPTAGGVPITIIGENFGVTGRVTIGDAIAPTIAHDHEQIVVILPEGAGIDHPLQVEVAQQLSNTLPFYYNPPQIQAISPANTPTQGGIPITVIGKDFGVSGSVLFDGAPAPTVTTYQHDLIEFVVPPGQGIGIPIRVEIGAQSDETTLFNYNPPQVTSIEPNTGKGGTTVTITGTSFGLSGVASVGSTPIQDVVSYDHNQIVARMPVATGVDAPITVNVAGQAGTSSATFSYVPRVVDVTPQAGPTTGNTVITIVGENFGAAPQAFVGNRFCEPLPGTPTDTIACLLPAGEGVSLPVTVVAGGLESAGNFEFSYFPPQITSIAPDHGSERGGFPLTINGSNFGTQGNVLLGTTPAAGVISHDHSQIVVIAPRGEPGDFPVTVSVGGQAATSAALFQYDRFGDATGDGELDEADLTQLPACLLGPQQSSVCPIFDDNLDGDVDLGDIASFQREFGT